MKKFLFASMALAAITTFANPPQGSYFRDPIPQDFLDPAQSDQDRADAGITDLKGEKTWWEGDAENYGSKALYEQAINGQKVRAYSLIAAAEGHPEQQAIRADASKGLAELTLVNESQTESAETKLETWGFGGAQFCHDMMVQMLQQAETQYENGQYAAALSSCESAYDWLDDRKRYEGGYTTSTGTYVKGVIDHITDAISYLDTAEVWLQQQQ